MAEGIPEPTDPPAFELPEDFASQVQAWEVPIEHLPEAVNLYKSIQTEEGQVDAFVRLGQQLGFGLKDLERIFVEETTPTVPAAPAPAAPAAPARDPEQLPTWAEIQELIESERKAVEDRFQAAEQLRQQESAQQTQARQQSTFAEIERWYTEHGFGKNLEAQAVIATLGTKHIQPGQDSYDPAVAKAALEAGLADYTAWVDQEAQRNLERKAAVASQQPTSLSGGGNTDSGSESAEGFDYSTVGAKGVETAKERVRRKLREAGEVI